MLLRYYPDQAGAFVQQGMNHLLDCWIQDCIRHPHAPLVARCQRLMPALHRLPDLRGKAVAVSGISRLHALAAYEDANRVLADLPRAPRVLTEAARRRREPIIRAAFRQLARASPHPARLNEWLHLGRHELALNMACAAVAPSLSPQRLRRVLRRLRWDARRVDLALKRA